MTPLLEAGAVGNPLDMGGIIGGPHRFAEVVAKFADEYDAVLAVSSAHPPAHSAARVESLLALETDTPVIHLWMAGDVSRDGEQILRAADLPVTVEPRAAVAAVWLMFQHDEAFAPAQRKYLALESANCGI